MLKQLAHHSGLLSIMRVAVDALLVMCFAVAALASHGPQWGALLPLAMPQAASWAAGLFFLNATAGFYDAPSRRASRYAYARAAFVLVLALPLTFAVFSLLPSAASGSPVLQWAAMAAVAAITIRRAHTSRRNGVDGTSARVLVFGSGAAAQNVGDLLAKADPDLRVVGYVPGPNESAPVVPPGMVLERYGSLADLARSRDVDEIVVALTERRAGSMPLRELLDCKLAGIKVYDINSHFEKRLGQIRLDYLNASWMVFGDGFNQGGVRSAVKRAFDLFFSVLLLLLAAPVMVLTAVLVKLESRGPVFYRQERVGQDGATFDVVKFRSMRTDAEKDGKPRWATANDDRVTRIGRFIRRTRIDELPQLFNVISGEMSLVGPRPERPFFVEQLTQQIPYFAVRHSVKPGVTGWAQVRYAYGATVEDAQAKLQFDLYYVKNHSLLLDIQVLIETVGVVLTGKGAR